MEFGSIVFLLRFLPIFFLCYFLVPGRMKNFILLLGSLCFYAWGMPLYLLLLLTMLSSDFCHGLLIEKYRGRKAADLLTGNALFLDGLLLFLFGYSDFGVHMVNSLCGTNWESMGLPIPMGLTVFTLQTMSYVLDVHGGRVEAQRNYLDYAMYVTLFPQMLFGPIVPYRSIASDIRERTVKLHRFSQGLMRFCVGLAKKVLLADVMGEVWMRIEPFDPNGLSFATAWLGILAFAFRMYYAYSGYADMAVGLAACLGFEFPENFRHPFAAGSVTDFLHRWNMTLVRFMREYFYKPIVTEKAGVCKQVFVMLFTWAFIGLWYGPDVTFLFWGLWMALFYIFEKVFWNKVQKILPFAINWILAMFVVSLGWVLFALDDLEDVWAYLLVLFGQGLEGMIDDRFFYLFSEYFLFLLMGILLALPQISMLVHKLRDSRKVLPMAIYRFGEKTVPPILLLLSLIKIAG